LALPTHALNRRGIIDPGQLYEKRKFLRPPLNEIQQWAAMAAGRIKRTRASQGRAGANDSYCWSGCNWTGCARGLACDGEAGEGLRAALATGLGAPAGGAGGLARVVS
jgi:hypothetical protein